MLKHNPTEFATALSAKLASFNPADKYHDIQA